MRSSPVNPLTALPVTVALLADFRVFFFGLIESRLSPRSGIAWTAQTLDTFLADPQKTIAGNRMPYAGMPDAADRADLIAYLLKTFK